MHQEKTKGYKMDKRFTPRTNEEMLAAVRAFQARQKVMYDRLQTKLEKVWLHLTFIVEKTHPDLELVQVRFEEFSAFLEKLIE